MTIRIPVWLRANILLLAIEGSVFPAGPALAQAPPGAPPGACTMPVSQRTSEVGCYLTATEVLGTLPQGAQFWHLYNYPTRAAAEAVKGPNGTVVESFGKVWLYRIADANWRPVGGDRIAVIGPLPLAAGTRYTARYMEAVFTAGMSLLYFVASYRRFRRPQNRDRRLGRLPYEAFDIRGEFRHFSVIPDKRCHNGYAEINGERRTKAEYGLSQPEDTSLRERVPKLVNLSINR